jgi:hypothetical protein
MSEQPERRNTPAGAWTPEDEAEHPEHYADQAGAAPAADPEPAAETDQEPAADQGQERAAEQEPAGQ